MAIVLDGSWSHWFSSAKCSEQRWLWMDAVPFWANRSHWYCPLGNSFPFMCAFRLPRSQQCISWFHAGKCRCLVRLVFSAQVWVTTLKCSEQIQSLKIRERFCTRLRCSLVKGVSFKTWNGTGIQCPHYWWISHKQWEEHAPSTTRTTCCPNLPLHLMTYIKP